MQENEKWRLGGDFSMPLQKIRGHKPEGQAPLHQQNSSSPEAMLGSRQLRLFRDAIEIFELARRLKKRAHF